MLKNTNSLILIDREVSNILEEHEHILFINPKSAMPKPDLVDDITEYFQMQFNEKIARNDCLNGIHICACSVHSTNQTYNITIGDSEYTTNSLALHYIKNHRSEVPIATLDLIRDAIELQNNIKSQDVLSVYDIVDNSGSKEIKSANYKKPKL